MKNFLILALFSFFVCTLLFGEEQTPNTSPEPNLPRNTNYRLLMSDDSYFIPNLRQNKPYMVDRDSLILFGPIEGEIIPENILIKISPDTNWNNEMAIEYNTKEFVQRKTSKGFPTYLQIMGQKIPEDYYVLIKEKKGSADILPYIILAKSQFHFYDIKDIFNNPLSLGISINFSLDGSEATDLTPFVYYPLRWVNKGDRWYHFLGLSSAGFFLNPSLSNFSSIDSLSSLLTAGVGLGLISNLVVVGVGRDFANERWILMGALNID